MKMRIMVFAVFAALGFAQTQEAAPEISETKPVLQRIKYRPFPSVFQAWNGCDDPAKDPEAMMAQHDLIFTTPEAMGLRWNNEYPGLADGFTADSLTAANQKRSRLLTQNPNLILLGEIHCRNTEPNDLPETHAWLLTDPNGKPAAGLDGKNVKLDIRNPALREHLARQAKAAIDSGVFDGVMIDYLQNDADCLELVKSIRNAIGPNPLLLCSSAGFVIPGTAPYVNGYYITFSRTETAEDWQHLAGTLQWAESNLRKPTINCLETFCRLSRDEVKLMRAATTLMMTVSDGYSLFADPIAMPTPDHLHAWYPFWDAKVGKPTADGSKQDKGYYLRPYEKGTAIYNPMGNPPVTHTFPKLVKSGATGKISAEHTLESCDGDVFLDLPDTQPHSAN